MVVEKISREHDLLSYLGLADFFICLCEFNLLDPHSLELKKTKNQGGTLGALDTLIVCLVHWRGSAGSLPLVASDQFHAKSYFRPNVLYIFSRPAQWHLGHFYDCYLEPYVE